MNNPACLNEEKRVFISVCRVSSESVWYSDIMCYNMLIAIEDENVFQVNVVADSVNIFGQSNHRSLNVPKCNLR